MRLTAAITIGIVVCMATLILFEVRISSRIQAYSNRIATLPHDQISPALEEYSNKTARLPPGGRLAEADEYEERGKAVESYESLQICRAVVWSLALAAITVSLVVCFINVSKGCD